MNSKQRFLKKLNQALFDKNSTMGNWSGLIRPSGDGIIAALVGTPYRSAEHNENLLKQDIFNLVSTIYDDTVSPEPPEPERELIKVVNNLFGEHPGREVTVPYYDSFIKVRRTNYEK